MYQFSDSDSSDSDAGIRFKTDSTRHKKLKRRSPEASSRSRRNSPKHSEHDRRKHRRSRSKSPSRHKSKRKSSTSRRDKFTNKSRSNSRERNNKYDRSKSKDEANKKRYYEEEKRLKLKELNIKNTTPTNTKRIKETTSKNAIETVDISNDGEFSDINSSSDELLATTLPTANEHITPLIVKLNENVAKSSINKEKDESLGPNPPLIMKLGENVTKLDTAKDPSQHLIVKISENVITNKVDFTTNVDILGPSLPPHLIKTKSIEEVALPTSLIKNNERLIGPPHLGIEQEEVEIIDNILGPSLPPHLIKTKIDEALTPHLLINIENVERSIGPTLPLHIRKQLEESANIIIENINEDEEEEEETYGPLPVDMILNSKAHIALEERALQLKLDKLIPKDDKTAREEWMIELPTVQASNLGLGPRQFRAKAGPDLSDRTAWTDTPEAKANKPEEKIDVKKEAELMEIRKRDQVQEEMSKKHKKKRDKSLLDIHHDKLKKKKKKEEAAGNERKPFSRDTDMKVNQFDEAQKKAIYKKAQFLDDRFSKGQAKFL